MRSNTDDLAEAWAPAIRALPAPVCINLSNAVSSLEMMLRRIMRGEFREAQWRHQDMRDALMRAVVAVPGEP